MANKRDYTITVVSESLYQYDNKVQAPFTLGGPFGPVNLRRKCTPYLAGPTTALQMGLRINCINPAFTPTSILLPLLADGAHIYSPTIIYDQNITEILITPGSQLYEPTLTSIFVQAMESLTPGAQLYNPTIQSGLILSMETLTPGAQLYNPTIDSSFILSMEILTPGAQLYNPTIDSNFILSTETLTPGAQLYSPVITAVANIDLSLLVEGGQAYIPKVRSRLTLPIPLISAGAETYNPSLLACPIQYTVGTGGDYATIQAAVDKVEASDQPLVCSYEILISGSVEYAENVVITNLTTTVANTLTLLPWPGTTNKSLPIINAGRSSGGSSETCLWIKDVDNVIIDGLKFTGWGWNSAGPNPATEPPGMAAVFLGRNGDGFPGDGISRITLQNCTMSAEDGGEYGVYSASGSTGNNNVINIYNCFLTGTATHITNGSVALFIGESYNTTISASTIRGWNSVGVSIQGDGVSSVGTTLKQSEISDCYGRAIEQTNQSQCNIENNLIYSCATGSGFNTIYLSGEVGATSWFYNTIVSTESVDDMIRWDGVIHTLTTNWTDNIYRFSTIDVGDLKSIYSFSDAPGSKFNSNFNLFSVIVSSGSAGLPVQYNTVAQCDNCDGGSQIYYPRLFLAPDDWNSAFGFDANSQEAHGLPAVAGIFTDESLYDFTLSPTSVALDAATNVGILVDKDGTVRPQGDGFDQGCYETPDP